MAKARSFTLSMEKMDEKQRSHTPSQEYADDYNNLRLRSLALYPHLSPVMPPEVATYMGAGGNRRYSELPYGEIATFSEQIFQLLAEQE